ncbi:MAG: hypothetical protein LBT36_04095 [Oscillospiraceae bacterium]|jgi:hypothetical protein|nr:hypothetical protein [Oscillospiraceae bacterium]
MQHHTTRRLAAIVLTLAIFLAALPAASAADKLDAVPSSQGLKINGENVAVFAAYNINGANYFKLRDIAYLLTDVFEVGYANNLVTLTKGKTYTKNGAESTAKPTGAPKEIGSTNDKFADAAGNTIAFTSDYAGLEAIYKIDGSNYFQIKGLGATFGFTVGYDDATKTIVITTPSGAKPPKTRQPGTVQLLDDDGSLAAYSVRAIAANLRVILDGAAKTDAWNTDKYIIKHPEIPGGKFVIPGNKVLVYWSSTYHDFVYEFNGSWINDAYRYMSVTIRDSDFGRTINVLGYAVTPSSSDSLDLVLTYKGRAAYDEVYTYSDYTPNANNLIESLSKRPSIDTAKVRQYVEQTLSDGKEVVVYGSTTAWSERPAWNEPQLKNTVLLGYLADGTVFVNPNGDNKPVPDNSKDSYGHYWFDVLRELTTEQLAVKDAQGRTAADWLKQHNNDYVILVRGDGSSYDGKEVSAGKHTAMLAVITNYDPQTPYPTVTSWSYINGTLTIAREAYPEPQFGDAFVVTSQADLDAAAEAEFEAYARGLLNSFANYWTGYYDGEKGRDEWINPSKHNLTSIAGKLTEKYFAEIMEERAGELEYYREYVLDDIYLVEPTNENQYAYTYRSAKTGNVLSDAEYKNVSDLNIFEIRVVQYSFTVDDFDVRDYPLIVKYEW